MLRYAIRLSVTVIFFTTFTVFIAAGYAQEHLFGVKGFVVDESGAFIPTAEATFKGESRTILAHAGMDGSVTANLEAGKYVVTIRALGFATAKLVDFSVSGPNADAFRVSLKADSVSWGSGSPNVGHLVEVPVPSEIADEPARTSLPAARTATTKHRSMRCPYLWRCSASQP